MHLVPGVGVEYPTGFVAVLFVEYAEVEHPVVDDQKEDRPLHEGPVESFHPFPDEGGFVVEVFQGEEVTRRDEEERHVELEDELTEPPRCLGMRYHHQDDGNAFADGYGRITFHRRSEYEGEQVAKPPLEAVPDILALFPALGGHIVALLHVLHEAVLQLMGRH